MREKLEKPRSAKMQEKDGLLLSCPSSQIGWYSAMQVSLFKHHQAPFEQVIEPRFGVVSVRGGCVPGRPVQCAVGGDGDGEVHGVGRSIQRGFGGG